MCFGKEVVILRIMGSNDIGAGVCGWKKGEVSRGAIRLGYTPIPKGSKFLDIT
jgi:hypothetical protein